MINLKVYLKYQSFYMKFVCKGKVNIALILFCSIVLEHFKSFHQYALKKKKGHSYAACWWSSDPKFYVASILIVILNMPDIILTSQTRFLDLNLRDVILPNKVFCLCLLSLLILMCI